MADSTRTIDVLLKEVADSTLRNRLKDAVQALRKQTKFGLVFEGHHPEVSRLPEVPIRKGSLVAQRSQKGNTLYRVESISGSKAICLPEELPDDEEDDLLGHSLSLPLSDLVAARRFGDAIYPSLKLVDSIQRGGEKPWHVLLQGDNYHALQALGYTHAGKVDVIYIDPPYNTGAKDWRYNNDYVDQNDPWRHSKWLSFMEKRLRLVKRLLKPNGVLVVTIDEHEVHHLGCLLEQLFLGTRMQMVSICINPSGASGDGLSRVEEYALFLFFGNAQPARVADDGLSESSSKIRVASGWESLLRRGSYWQRKTRPNLCYPVLLDPQSQKIVGVGKPFSGEDETRIPSKIEGNLAAWPIRKDGSLGIWRVDGKRLVDLAGRGFAFATNFDKKRNTWALRYLMSGAVKAIERGELSIQGKGQYGEALIQFNTLTGYVPKTMWVRGKHNAGGSGGSQLLAHILAARGAFTYPKSVYAVIDCLRAVLGDRKDAVILDFFAGSGTTYHAVSLMNAVDGGSRKCLLVTNNEVSEDDRKQLRKDKRKEGDQEWDAKGICRAVTWPRCKYVTAGKRDDESRLTGTYSTGKFAELEIPREIIHLGMVEGSELDLAGRKDVVRMIEGITLGAVAANQPWHLEESGTVSILWDISKADEWLEALAEEEQVKFLYIVSRNKGSFKKLAANLIEALPPLTTEQEIKRPMAEGFEENLAYFELGFLEPGDVARGKQFAAILPLLWMLTGAKGKCPKPGSINKWLIAEDCRFAVLHREELFEEFRAVSGEMKGIEHVFLVTDSEDTFKEMRTGLRKSIRAHMLYSSYLRNFGINLGATP